MTKVFVYGTLRSGERNHHFLKGAECIYSQCRVHGKLFDTDKGYPVLQRNESTWVFGELYDVTESQMQAIDVLEDYKEGRSDNLYDKVVGSVWNGLDGEYNAVIYTAEQSMDYSTQKIPSGDWCVYQYIKQENLLYFAYGSCLDYERFQKAGADHLFTEMFGSGLLKGFEFRFSIHTKDGGKADIVENKAEFVEGKVYRIPFEALTYLYKREGVHSEVYRPAIVPVTINGDTFQTLTFIGMNKSGETAPTSLYATEILRGGKDCLSRAYREKLKQKIDGFQEG